MRVEPLVPDAPSPSLGEQSSPGAAQDDAFGFVRALDMLGATLTRAQSAEDSFATGRGRLHDAIYERARADVALAVATTAAQRAAQAIQSILNMQV